MKKILILLICSILFACNNKSDNSTKNDLEIENPKTVMKKDSISWIEDFKAFRNAIYHNEMNKVKTYIEFKNPKIKGDIIHQGLILESGNNCFSNEEEISKENFEKYYHDFFPTSFTKTILKIQSEQLGKIGDSESPMIKIADTSYKMSASFNKTTNELVLNLYSEKIVDEDENNQIRAEYSMIYTFSIKNKKMKLIKIDCAG